MTGAEVIQGALRSTQFVLEMYLSDLSDADLLVRPVPGANHIAWQLGHLISTDSHLIPPQVPGVKYPDYPPGFAQQHGKETSASDSPKGFLTKAQYLDLFQKTRQVTLDLVGKLSPADLEKPTVGPMAKYAPKLADLLLLVSNHTLMHAGQFTVVRRKLGKPVLF